MVFDWATQGPYEGHTVVLVEEYQGYGIYFASGPGGIYLLVDPLGVELDPMMSTHQAARDYIDSVVGPPEEPPLPPVEEPPEEPEPKQPFTEYRGCVIFVWPLFDPYHFNSSCTVTHRLSIEAVKADIDTLLGPEPDPIPDPTAKTLWITYRDIEIFELTVSKWFTFETPVAVYSFPGLAQCYTQIDQDLGPIIGPDTYVTQWGAFSIWKSGSTGMYYVIVDEVAQGEFNTVLEAQAYIENVLGYDPTAPLITPGEEPSYTDMGSDPARAALIAGPVKQFLNSVGLTEEALGAVLGSGADPEKAAAYAKSVSMASVGAVAILGTIGVVAEVASLGQIEGVLGTMDMVLEKTGISGLLDELFRLPFMSALVAPARHYWNSVYTPELPGSGDLITFLVREIITPDEFNKTMALHGYSQKWADDYWEAHWRLPSIGDIIRAEHLGIITKEERDTYFILHDYRSDNRPGISTSDLEIYGGLTKTLLGRVDTRRAYQYGYMERPALVEMYKALGYEEDSELQADIQIRASVDGLQSAIRREEGMIYRDRLKDAREDESSAVGVILADRNTKLADLGNATIAGEFTEEEAAVIEADIRAKAEVAIAEVRAKARAREEEVEELYRTALEEVKANIDPEDLWVLRYKLAADRVEVAEEFEITPPVEVVETPEEPE